MRLSIAAVLCLAALASGFYQSPAPKLKSRGGNKQPGFRGAKKSPRLPAAPPFRQLQERFGLKVEFTLPTAQDARETALALIADIRPVQVLAGFALAFGVIGSTIVAGTNAIGEFLEEDGNGMVLERAITFGTILEDVKGAYVDQNIDLDVLFERGVNSMLSLLDPFSTYENSKQAEDLNVRTTGRYAGVGLTIGKDGDDILVISALEGYAFDAGVRPGDRILTVNNQKIGEGTTVDEVCMPPLRKLVP